MEKGKIQVIYGSGIGKTSCAIGEGVRAAAAGKRVIMVQFLKGNMGTYEAELWKRLEPEIRIFRFEKSAAFFETLSEEEKQEEQNNIRNGLNFARKVMTTGECDLLILDEFLGILEKQIITEEEVLNLLNIKDQEMDLIVTGKCFPEKWKAYADRISRIENEEA